MSSNTDYFGNYQIPNDDIVVPNSFMSNTLQCDWGNTRGRCGEEVSYITTLDRPPCGHDVFFSRHFEENAQVMRFCARHMVRFMFTSLTHRTCGVCGSEYKGLAILKSLERL